jgi:hypothetical protein
MAFEEYLKENKAAFLLIVEAIAKRLNVKPEHLMFVMWFETSHTFSPVIQNKYTGAIGLIQFMPKTARELGTSTEELRQMENTEQLQYVLKYLLPYKGRFVDFVDLYCALFWPAAIGKLDSFRITPDIVAKQNPLFDVNKDGDIEMLEIRKTLLNQVPIKYRELFV